MDTVVALPSGSVRGTTTGEVSRFLGVPYAASPARTGWLQPSVPVEPWVGVRDAVSYGPTVPKNPYPWPSSELLAEPEISGEECLNLNVWTPNVNGSAPVFVWIHGGAFRNGSGAVPQYDGTAFARDGVVCVTINYRLGVFGFADFGDEHTNIGLRDQLAALRWVQDNIAHFGGDPARVTIGGESAGGMSVGCLLSSPLSTGLFRAAILQSGAGHHALPRASAQVVATELAQRLGVPPTRDALAEVPPALVLAEQDTLCQEIQLSGDVARWGKAAVDLMAFEPVVDGDVLPALPIDSVSTGAGRDVPVLIGSTADEFRFFSVPSGVAAQVTEEALAGAAAAYGVRDAPTAYPDGTPGERLSALMTDWFFRIPAVRLAEARAGAAPTHMYEFAWPSRAIEGLGSCHALEIAFVFDTLGAQGTERLTGPNPPQHIADEMHAAWVRFIVDGDPGWPAYTPDDRVVRVFDTDSSTVTDPRPIQRKLWDGVR
ncbi:carboxylesterase/lipase family protein [Skermania sp. ID1734]|uniref:carboxylesterase/lipase family protein n=1 Tax=Skermania sp. ID1734 TaxID=2597516 RepID=UPI00117C2200|nr:carboxylesterase family protein [Skermania sp. ID1734]TSE01999.1 carboxylesterase/lipase family protein [Skermania sp. ID1734]